MDYGIVHIFNNEAHFLLHFFKLEIMLVIQLRNLHNVAFVMSLNVVKAERVRLDRTF